MRPMIDENPLMKWLWPLLASLAGAVTALSSGTVQMLPCTSSPDRRNHADRYSILTFKRPPDAMVLGGGDDRLNLFLGKLGRWVRSARKAISLSPGPVRVTGNAALWIEPHRISIASRSPTKADVVASVLLRGRPSEIARRVVVFVTIPMGRLMARSGRRAMPLHAHKAMNFSEALLSIGLDKADDHITSFVFPAAHEPSRSVARISTVHDALDAPNARNRVIGECANCAPFFALIFRGSHLENHLSFGQGLALLTQRLRPVFVPKSPFVCKAC